MRTSKYGAKKTVVDSIQFSSKLEAKHYVELKVMKRAGIVADFEIQPEFVLQDKFKDRDGKSHRAIKYIADFYVRYHNGVEEVWDSKGMKTQAYAIKKKMFLHKYPQYSFKEMSS